MTRPFVARGACFEEALERIARAGYRHLHFGPSDRRADDTAAVPEGATPEQLAALAELCARHGLAPTSMFPHRGGDLAAETLETFRAEEDMKQIADLAVALCVKDHRGPRGHDDFPTPGDGEVDHRSMLTTLRAAGFSGPCLVELVGGATPAETEHEARRAFAHLQDTIGS